MSNPDLLKETNSGDSGRGSPREMEEKKPPQRTSRKKLWILAIILAVIVIVVVLSTTLSLLLDNSSGSGSDRLGNSDSKKPHWPGWSEVKHLAIFGDSMTNVDFDFRGQQPSEANPIGNPAFPGRTSSILENWAGYLTGTYNATFLKTVDLGSGGATVDADIYDSPYPTTRSFADQVLSDWIPHYTKSKPSQFQWMARDTLFATFFGLNDVRGAFFESRGNALSKSVARYAELLGDLYDSGARNFLVLNLSPFERAPLLNRFNDERKREMGDFVTEYNIGLARALSDFSDSKPDATVFLFDSHKLFTKILDDPQSSEETKTIRDTTDYCAAYHYEREDAFRDDPACPYALDQYFWINEIHPTFRVHKAFAKGIADYLNHMS